MLILFVRLRGGHSKFVKGKIRSYVLLISGAYVFRLMRFKNGFMLKCVVMIRK